jgi:3-dehydroquinate synthase
VAANLTRTFLPAPTLGPGRPRLLVTGFMGTGKTAAGSAAARLLDLPFIDLDDVIRRRASMPIAQIFAEEGEASFRHMEREVLEDAARISGAVIATGGGAVLHRDAFRRLSEDAVVVVLTTGTDELNRRLAIAAGRPILGHDPETRIEELLAERSGAYAAAGPVLDTTHQDVRTTAAELVARYREAVGASRSATIAVPGPNQPYPAIIRDGLLERVGGLVHRLAPGAVQAALVTDAGVADSWGGTVADSLAAAGLSDGTQIVLPPGERAKTAAEVEGLWEALRRRHLGRLDPVVAVGGGATLDAAGFAAATYARGVPLVNVPTTLLAMVDAGLGGKVGIDHAGVKNLVGSFHHPVAVLADPVALSTLPVRHLRAGLAECVKAALAASPLALESLEVLPLGDEDVPIHLSWIVEQAVRIKAAYVREDPEDHGVRHALNLGHTFAHAIESASDYHVLHGEAVAIGLAAAARLGASLGVTDPRLPAQIESVLSRLGLPVTAPPGLDEHRLRDALEADKKRRGGQVAFVLPCPGGVDLIAGLDPDRALSALAREGALAS